MKKIIMIVGVFALIILACKKNEPEPVVNGPIRGNCKYTTYTDTIEVNFIDTIKTSTYFKQTVFKTKKESFNYYGPETDCRIRCLKGNVIFKNQLNIPVELTYSLGGNIATKLFNPLDSLRINEVENYCYGGLYYIYVKYK